MSRAIRIALAGYLLFLLYHLLRDIMQLYGAENILASVGHREHIWCGSYCEAFSFILELISIPLAMLALKQGSKKVGLLVLLGIPVWLITWFLP